MQIKQKNSVSENVSLTIMTTWREKFSQAFLFFDSLSIKHKKPNLKILVILIAEKHELKVIEHTKSERFVYVLKLTNYSNVNNTSYLITYKVTYKC